MSRIFPGLLSVLALVAGAQPLPAPVVHGNSFEILSNSRYSVHSGFTAALSDTVMSNVLWAMSRAPSFGGPYRQFYVATPSNVYLYNPGEHSLAVHLAGDHRYSPSSAFEAGVAMEREEEAGLAIQAGLLAGIASWTRGASTTGCCPMQYATNHANSNWNPEHAINMVDVFGARPGVGLTDSCVARSSDSTLTLPTTDGADTFELVVGDLRQDTVFDPTPLSLAQVSQLLWAGYGVTPHMPIGKRGLTIPSAVAYYLLTRRIYLVWDQGVARFHNRLPPGTNLTTTDHRLEALSGEDRRDSLRAACGRLPGTAPAYIVVCVEDTSNSWHTQEAGFAGFQYLAQARIIGLGGCLTAPLTLDERAAIQAAVGIPGADIPVIVFSVGALPTGVLEAPGAQPGRMKLRSSHGLPARIEYSLPAASTVEFRVTDLAGRAVRSWAEQRPAGKQVSEWPGTDDAGSRVPAGAYVVSVRAGEETGRARVVLPR